MLLSIIRVSVVGAVNFYFFLMLDKTVVGCTLQVMEGLSTVATL